MDDRASEWIVPAEALERAAARNLLDCIEAYRAIGSKAAVAAIQCAGGVAAFTGVESPLTTVKGAGPEITDDDIDGAEEFFRKHGARRMVFELAPWITEGTAERLKRRGYGVTASEDVVVKAAPFETPAPDGRIAVMDAANWAALAFEAFECPDTPMWRELIASIAALPGAVNLGVFDVAENRWIACAQAAPCSGMAMFACDATLPSARGRGAQTALIRERFRHAAAMGVDYAGAEVAAGSTSERNYLRCGFRVVYGRSYYAREIG